MQSRTAEILAATPHASDCEHLRFSAWACTCDHAERAMLAFAKEHGAQVREECARIAEKQWTGAEDPITCAVAFNLANAIRKGAS